MTQERDELVEFIEQITFVLPNLNDTFAYACADTEQICVGDGEILAAFWRRHGWYGLVAIAAHKRGKLPLSEVAEDPRFVAALDELRANRPVDDEGWTLLEEFELARSDG